MAADPNISISVKVGESRAQIKSLKDEIKGLDAGFKATSVEMKHTGTESGLLTEKQKKLAAQLERQKQITEENSKLWQKYTNDQATSLAKLGEAQNALANAKKVGNTEAIEKHKEEIEGLIKHYASATNSIEAYAKEIEKSEKSERLFAAELKNVNIELKQHSSVLQEVDGNIQQFSDNYRKGAESVQGLTNVLDKAGTAMTIGVTAPLTAAAGAALVAGQEINKNLANIATLDIGTDRLKELKTGIQEIAISVGKDTTDITDGVYSVISAFDDSNDTLEKTKLNAKSAAAGLASTKDALALTISVTKGYNDTSIEATRKASDLAFQAVKIGEMTYTELASSIGKVVPVSNTLKISQEELFNVFATLTGVTGGASEVASQYYNVLNSLIKPNEDMVAILKKQGYASGFAAVEALGFKGTLDMLEDATHGNNEALVKLVGRQEAVTAMLALTGAQSESYTKNLIEMQNALGATDRAFAAQTEGVNAAGFSFQQSMARMQVAAQDFAETMAPAVEWAADKVEALTEWLGSLDDEQRKAIVTIGAVVAAVGPLLSVSSKMITVVAGLKSVMGASAVATTAAGTAAGTASVGFSALLGPVGLVAAALGVCTALWYNYKKGQEEAIAAINELSESYRLQNEEFDRNEQTIDNIKKHYAELASGVDKFGRNVNLTTEQYEDYNGMQKTIAGMFPELILGYDNEGNAILSLKGTVEEMVAELDRLVAKQREAYNQKIVNDSDKTLKGLQTEIGEYEAQIKKLYNEMGNLNIEKPWIEGLETRMFNAEDWGEIEEFRVKLKELGVAYKEVGEEFVGGFATKIKFEFEDNEAFDKYLKTTREKYEFETQEIQDKIADVQKKIDAEFIKFNPVIKAHMELDFRYTNFDSQLKEIAQQLALGLDINKLGLKTSEDIKKYVEDNILSPLWAVMPQAQEVFENIFDLQKSLKNKKIDLGEFKQSVQEEFSHIFDGLDTEVQDTLAELLRTAGIAGDDIASLMSNLALSMSGVSQSITDATEPVAEFGNKTDTAAESAERLSESMEKAKKTASDLISEVDSLTRAFEEQAKSGELTAKTAMSMIDNGYALALQIDAETGAITLNERAYKGLIDAKLREQIVSLKSAKSTLMWDKMDDEQKTVRHTAQSYLDLAEAKYRDAEAGGMAVTEIEKQIAVLNNLRNNLNDKSVSGMKQDNDTKDNGSAARDAEAARKAELAAWKAYWAERVADSEHWLNTEKFYDRLNEEAERESYGRIIEYLKGAQAEILSLEFATAEERELLWKEYARRIEDYQKKQHTIDTNKFSSEKNKYDEKEAELNSLLELDKYYGNLSAEAEKERLNQIIEHVKNTQTELLNIDNITAEQRLKIQLETARKIEELEKKKDAIDKNEVTTLKSSHATIEDDLKRELEIKKFYSDESEKIEYESYGRLIEFLKQAQTEILNLESLTTEQRLEIAKEYDRKIEDAQMKQYTASRSIDVKKIADAKEQIEELEYIQNRATNSTQGKISGYESLTGQLKGYADYRKQVEQNLVDELARIDSKYWLTEKEQMREIEAAYDRHSAAIVGIDKETASIRKEILSNYLDEWYKAQNETLTNNYNARKDSLKRENDAKKEALNNELSSIRSYYAAIDAAERSSERSQELGDLNAQAKLYEGAATKEGQDKYKSIMSQIRSIEKEAAREQRQEAQRSQEEAIQNQVSALDKEYEASQTALDKQYDANKKALDKRYEMIKDGTAQLAEITKDNLEDTADNLASGVQGIFDEYERGFEDYSKKTLQAAKQWASEVGKILGTINTSFGVSGSSGSNIQNNSSTSKSASLTIYDNSVNNFDNTKGKVGYLDDLVSTQLYTLMKRV